MRTVLVVLHATPGVVGLVAGLLAFSPPRPGDGRRWWRRLYALCIAVLLVALVVLVAYDWSDLEAVARLAFAGLVALGAVMATRLLLARRTAQRGGDGWRRRYVAHLYFTYIALWIGLLIVPAISSPWPQFAVPGVVIACLALGAVLVSRYQRRVPVS